MRLSKVRQGKSLIPHHTIHVFHPSPCTSYMGFLFESTVPCLDLLVGFEKLSSDSEPSPAPLDQTLTPFPPSTLIFLQPDLITIAVMSRLYSIPQSSI